MSRPHREEVLFHRRQKEVLFHRRQKEVLFRHHREEVLFRHHRLEVWFRRHRLEVLEEHLYSLSDLGLGDSHCLLQNDCQLFLYRQQDYWFRRRHHHRYLGLRYHFRHRKNNVSTNPEYIEYGLGLPDWNHHLALLQRHQPRHRHHLQWWKVLRLNRP